MRTRILFSYIACALIIIIMNFMIIFAPLSLFYLSLKSISPILMINWSVRIYIAIYCYTIYIMIDMLTCQHLETKFDYRRTTLVKNERLIQCNQWKLNFAQFSSLLSNNIINWIIRKPITKENVFLYTRFYIHDFYFLYPKFHWLVF